MLTMATNVTRYFIQTTPRLHRLFGAWVGAMKGTEVCLRRESATKDALGNALLLWAKDQDPEELAQTLEPYLDEFQRLWANREAGHADSAAVPVDITPPTGSVGQRIDPKTGRPLTPPTTKRKRGSA